MAVLALIFWAKMEVFDEEKTDPEKIESDENIIHGSYKWIIMLKKCGHPDLTVFHLIWVTGTYDNWNQNSGAVLELPAKQQCQFSPFTSKPGQMGWIGSAV